MPSVSRVALLGDAARSGVKLRLKEAETASRVLGLSLQFVDAPGSDPLEGAFAALGKGRPDAIMVLSDSVNFARRRQILALAAKTRLPAMYEMREWVEGGGLMGYGPHAPDLFRRAATFVDKILKGSKLADLPVEQPTKFELIVNVKATKQLGLSIPPLRLSRADEVIQ